MKAQMKEPPVISIGKKKRKQEEQNKVSKCAAKPKGKRGKKNVEEELPEITHSKVETQPPKETKQSSKPKVKKVTPKTKVTPVPDIETKNIEEQ